MKSPLLLLSLIPVGLCTNLALYAKELSNDKYIINLGKFEYDIESKNITITEASRHLEDIKEDTPYCIGISSNDNNEINSECFSFLELIKPIQYELVLDIDIEDNEIQKFSLVHNSEARGIEPTVNEPALAPMAPAIKLKKVTKTYADMRKSKQKGAEQFSEKSTEEDSEDVDNRNYFLKNWKQLLVGLLIYNFVVGFVKKDDKKKD